MPFVSEKQRKFLWANKPEVARKFAEHARKTLKGKKKKEKKNG